jgi:hypothetical protein
MARTDATAKFINATEKLHQTVTRAFNQEPDHQRTTFYERERLAAALVGVAQYFTSVIGRPIGDQFFELASAIEDLNVGTVHPLLKRERADHRRADPSQVWRARAHTVLGLEALLRSGLNRDEAIAKIASHCPNVADLARVRRDRFKLDVIVFGWRREFKANRVKNFEANEVFAEGIKRIDLLKSAHRHRAFALRQFAEAARSSRVLSPAS